MALNSNEMSIQEVGYDHEPKEPSLTSIKNYYNLSSCVVLGVTNTCLVNGALSVNFTLYSIQVLSGQENCFKSLRCFFRRA